jgi:hypothetical protein
MRSSTFITVLGAGLAIASPIVRKDLVTEVVTDVVFVYVTESVPSSTPLYTTVSPPGLSVKARSIILLLLVHFLLPCLPASEVKSLQQSFFVTFSSQALFTMR